LSQSLVCPGCERTVVAGDRFCGNCGYDVLRNSREQRAVSPLRALAESLQRSTLGEYEIREELGRGGMAFVFLAHEISLNRKVALKVLAPHLHAAQGMSTRFLREARTAAGLEHPNIIPIFAVRETPDHVFFTMRWISGLPLSAIAKQVGKLPARLVQSLLADVGSALSFAHRAGVLHRDVKPGNVLIGRDGGVFVTDFGIAKQGDGEGLTLTGQLLGTPGYMSPEQCRGHDVSPASDQYSLGAMAFELIAGRPAFVGNNAMDVMAMQMTQPAPDLLALRPDCPPALASAIQRMLSKEPHQRFPSVDEALRASGAAPLYLGDPVRAQLIEWLEHPSNVRSFAVTPVSPTPRASDSAPPRRPTPISSPAAGPSTPAAPPVTPAQHPSPPTPSGAPAQAPDSPPQRTPPDLVVRVPSIRTPAVESDPDARTVVEPPSGARHHRQAWVASAPPAASTRRLAVAVGAVAMLVLVVAVWRWMAGSGEPRGQLLLTGVPSGAVILVDGVATTGPRIDLPAGRHQVRIEAQGFETALYTLTVGEGRTDTLRYAGTPLPSPVREGTLVVTGLPSAGRVTINGERLRGRVFALPEGRHTLLLEATGYNNDDREIVVQAGRTDTLSFAGTPIIEPRRIDPGVDPGPPPPPPSPGTLMLRVRPFARILLDGRFIVEDEQLIRSLSAGRHRLRFERDGFEVQDTTVTISSGDTLRVRFALLRKPS